MARILNHKSVTKWLLPLLLVLPLICGCNPPPVPLGPIVGPALEPDMEVAVIRAVNVARLQEGLDALEADAMLTRMARDHSRDMVRMERLSHRGSDRLLVQGRADHLGVDWHIIGENVARNRGYEDPVAKAVLEWMSSKGHRENILNKSYTHTGVGVVRGRDGYIYFTQVFLLPMP